MVKRETIGWRRLGQPWVPTAKGTDTTEFARKKPDLVIRSVAEFSKPQYKVDILKLEFPADLTSDYRLVA